MPKKEECVTVTLLSEAGTDHVMRLGNAVGAQDPALSRFSTTINDDRISLIYDAAQGRVHFVLTNSATPPAMGYLLAGLDETGMAALAAGTAPITASGPQPPLVMDDLMDGDYYLHLAHLDGSGAPTALYSSPVLRVVAPVVPTPGVTAKITITRRSRLQIAPEGLFFELELDGFDTPGPQRGKIYDPQFHNLYYYWDYGDSYTYSAPDQVINKEAGQGFGPMGAHIYRKPGPYRVTCTIVEPATGKAAIATLDIAVGDPDRTFVRDNQTIVVDATGRGLAAYPKAAVVTSPNEALRAVHQRRNDQIPIRIILRRGQSFTSPGFGFGGNANRPQPSMHILAADEAGERPRIDFTGSLFWNDMQTSGNGNDKDFIWQGIDCVGGWDPRTETGTPFTGFAMFANPPQQFLLDQCVVRNFGDECIYNGGGVNNGLRSTFINDTVITAWGSYGFLDGKPRETAITGSAIYQDPLANAGGPRKKPRRHNNHGGYRAAAPGRVLIHATEMYSRNDWFENNGIWGQQPNLRFDTDGVGGGRLSVQACVFEGGNNVITFGAERQFVNKTINALVEKSYLLASHATRYVLATGKSGITIRNNVATVPDTPMYPGYDIRAVIRARYATRSGENAQNRDGPLRIYSNTIVNLSRVPALAVELAGFTDAVAANNLIHMPNIPSPITTDGPLDTRVLFTPREPGYKDSKTPLQTAYATPAQAAASYAPLDGSEALGAAVTGFVAYDDFEGVVRPQYPSRGAWEKP